jgi:sec-independent protein translocase protein TatC
MLGVAIVFELPVLIFFLTLLRVTTPRFLLVNSRYAILAIVVLAAIITPTPDVVNLVIFSVPMVLLYFVGVFASYLLVLHREDRRFPWGIVFTIIGVVIIGLIVGTYFAVTRFGYSLVPHWPFLLR